MISQSERKRFRAIAHKLKPVVTIAGNGVSPAVKKELERALDDHELIKIRINSGDREERKELLATVITSTAAETIQSIGGVAVLFRPAAKPNPALSNILRADVH